MNPRSSKPAEKPDVQRGLVCPKCGCQHFRVIYTRASCGGRVVRRRECRYCGRRMTTTERANEPPISTG